MRAKFSLTCAVAAAITSLLASAASASSIGGDSIDLTYLFPDTSTVFASYSTTVPGSIDYTAGTATFSADLITLNNDLLPDYVFSPGVFNGVEITDVTNPSALSTWAVDPALTTMVGFSEYISGGSIFVNWQNLPIAGQVALSNTPLPAALPLFAGGLGVVGLLARRRKRKNTAALAAA